MIGLFAVFIADPWIALLPGLAFAIAGYRRRSTAAWIAAAAWILYAVYETGMSRRIFCTGECDIRFDLLGIFPLLLVITVVAVLFALLKRRT